MCGRSLPESGVLTTSGSAGVQNKPGLYGGDQVHARVQVATAGATR